MKPDCDVLVLGAGPAGSSLAAHLGARGHRVILADRKAFPRAKPCGEFLGPQCTPYLRELGVAEPLQSLGAVRVGGMTIHGAGLRAPGRFRQPTPTSVRDGCAVRREVLDPLLLDRARRESAVAWRERHAFASLLRAADGRICGAVLRTPDRTEQRVTARFVVGADGVHSPVARALGLQRRTAWLDRFALVTRYRGVPAATAAEVHLLRGGYFAATAVDSGLFHVNLVVDRSALREHPAGWDAFVQSWIDRAPAFAVRLQAAERTEPWRGIGPLAHTTTAQAVPGAALAGDACGYVDPLTGEGIYFALFTARRLAEALDAVLAGRTPEPAALADYQCARRRELGPRLFAARLLQRGLRSPWVTQTVLQALARWPLLADLIVTLSGDAAHPRDLVRPSFWRHFCAPEASA